MKVNNFGFTGDWFFLHLLFQYALVKQNWDASAFSKCHGKSRLGCSSANSAHYTILLDSY